MEQLPRIIEASQLPEDELLRRKASTLIGSVAARSSLHVEPTEPTLDAEPSPISDLAMAIERAREGDELALEMIRTNVTTDYFERAYKYGFVSEVSLTRDSRGHLQQYSQSLQDVHLNSIAYLSNDKMRQRAKIEALNSLRDQQYADSGLLRSSYRVIFSLVHDGMDDQEAALVGFFAPTRSISLQVLSEEDAGFVMQTAFVAGREHQSADAFDKEAIVALAAKLGIDYAGASSEEILARPLLIPKSYLPDGITSLVQDFDAVAATITGAPTFFGRQVEQDKTTIDYIQKQAENKQQIAALATTVEQVTQELLSTSPTSAVAATERLAALNDAVLKKRIINDTSIDARVLGEQVAYYVEHARHFVALGMPQHKEVELLQQMITREGKSSSCPNGGKGATNDLGSLLEGESSEETNDAMPEDCEFVSKECPKCGEKNVKTWCIKGKYYGECGCSS